MDELRNEYIRVSGMNKLEREQNDKEYEDEIKKYYKEYYERSYKDYYSRKYEEMGVEKYVEYKRQILELEERLKERE